MISYYLNEAFMCLREVLVLKWTNFAVQLANTCSQTIYNDSILQMRRVFDFSRKPKVLRSKHLVRSLCVALGFLG